MDRLAFQGIVVGVLALAVFRRILLVTLDTAVYPGLAVVGVGMWLGWGAILAVRLWSVRSPRIDPTVPVRDAIRAEAARLGRAARHFEESPHLTALLLGGGQALSYIGFGGHRGEVWYTVLVALFLISVVVLAYRTRNLFVNRSIRPILDELEGWIRESERVS